MNRYKFIDEGRKHCHTLDGKELVGGSTLKGIIGDKGGLYQYYADHAAVSGLSFPQQDISAEFLEVAEITDKKEKAIAKQKLDKKYPNFAEARRAAMRDRDEKAEKGTLRHGVLEDYIRNCIETFDGKPLVTTESAIFPFVEWAMNNVDVFYFTEAHCYDEDLWVGGIADLGLRLKDGRRLVGDHKSSNVAYEDQFLQCGIYDRLLMANGILDRNGNKLGEWQPADGYVIFPFRSEPFTPEFRWNADAFRRAVDANVYLYRLLELGFSNPPITSISTPPINKEDV